MATRESFKQFLEKELKHRKSMKPDYSVRYFAKDLGLDHSFLAKLLKGSRAITPLTLRRLGPKLGLTHGETDLYLDDILQRQVGRRPKAPKTKAWIKNWSPENFSPISEWYFTAILSAISLKTFEPKGAWIAKHLGIPVSDASTALEQLEKLGYFHRDANGCCVVNDKQNSVPLSKTTTPQLKRYQKQALFKSIAALEGLDVSQRDHAVITVATTREKVDLAKPMIKAFRRKLMEFLESVDSPELIYDFTTSLFPLSQTSEEENK